MSLEENEIISQVITAHPNVSAVAYLGAKRGVSGEYIWADATDLNLAYWTSYNKPAGNADYFNCLGINAEKYTLGPGGWHRWAPIVAAT
ncbi:unnamed protein product, partial [Mesorhabditis spiculigera]